MNSDNAKAKHYLGVRLVLSLSALLILALCPAASAASRIAKLTVTFTAVPAPKTTLRVAALSSVACTSRQFCVAVGPNYSEVTAEKTVSAPTVIDQFNGRVWTRSKSPSPSAKLNILESVSCSSSTFCLAVGGDEVRGTEVPLTERFNGHSWSVVSNSTLYPGTPTTSMTMSLSSVSCVSASFCMAVGTVIRGSSQNGFLYSTVQGQFNGSVWTRSPDSYNGQLTSVSCVSKTSCIAGGQGPPGSVVASFADFNGKSWGGLLNYSTPFGKLGPSGASGSASAITGVSCVKGLFRGTVPSAMGRLCLVEGWGLPNGRYTPFVGYVTPANGAQQENPVTFVHHPGLNPVGMACVSTGCVVIGKISNASSSAFAAVFAGAWSLRPTAAPPGGEFIGVACVRTWCVAVGTVGKSSEGALIEQTT